MFPHRFTRGSSLQQFLDKPKLLQNRKSPLNGGCPCASVSQLHSSTLDRGWPLQAATLPPVFQPSQNITNNGPGPTANMQTTSDAQGLAHSQVGIHTESTTWSMLLSRCGVPSAVLHCSHLRDVCTPRLITVSNFAGVCLAADESSGLRGYQATDRTDRLQLKSRAVPSHRASRNFANKCHHAWPDRSRM